MSKGRTLRKGLLAVVILALLLVGWDTATTSMLSSTLKSQSQTVASSYVKLCAGDAQVLITGTDGSPAERTALQSIDVACRALSEDGGDPVQETIALQKALTALFNAEPPSLKKDPAYGALREAALNPKGEVGLAMADYNVSAQRWNNRQKSLLGSVFGREPILLLNTEGVPEFVTTIQL